jgi:hypothetical protein
MSELSHYWNFNKLNLRGQITVEEITKARDFIQEECSEIIDRATSLDFAIQEHLFGLYRGANALAEICLRCFISEQIKQVCIKLEQQFGNNYGFDRRDIFPYVLNDVLRQPKNNENTSFATKVLQSFDPQQSKLSTWTTRMVRYEQNLNLFLLERGIYIITDWAILNDTNSKQLGRIFQDFHNLDRGTIDKAISLLEAYHKIYRQARLANRKVGTRSKCQDPSLEQLQQITRLLQLSLSSEQMLAQLKNLAEKLREYRIFVRGGKIRQDSLETPDIQNIVEKRQIEDFSDDSEERSTGEFLSSYRQQFLNCLELAISSVMNQWIARQKQEKKQKFIQALKLFHCQGFSMTAIAPEIGLEKQYQVTRLMQLKDLRSDVRHKMLQELRQQIREIANIYINADELNAREEQIEMALSEQVDVVIDRAESEASTAKDRPLTSIFARYLCHYLDSQ